MSPRLKFSVVSFSTLLTVMLVIGALTGEGKEKDEGAYRPLSVYTEVLARIKGDYVEEPDMDKVTRGALQGLVEYLDPLSSYLTPEQFEAYQASQSNPDGGSGLCTGLLVHKRGSYTQALAVLPDSPADEAGIRRGDFIEAVDGLSTRALPSAYIHSLLSGEPDSQVRLLVRSPSRPDEPEEHVLVRAGVDMPSVESKMLEEGIGYIRVRVVNSQRVDEIAEAVSRLQAQGAGKFILDLRGAAIGEEEQGVRLADLFLKEGAIASLKGQRYPEERFQAAPSAVTDAPLVLVADRTTAGAAEIAVGALLDTGRADVAGEGTFGLAARQRTITLDDGAALILSVAKYYRPKGKAIQEGGVEPNFPLTPEALRKYRQSELEGEIQPEGEEGDPFVQKAIEILSGEAAAEAKAA